MYGEGTTGRLDGFGTAAGHKLLLAPTTADWLVSLSSVPPYARVLELVHCKLQVKLLVTWSTHSHATVGQIPLSCQLCALLDSLSTSCRGTLVSTGFASRKCLLRFSNARHGYRRLSSGAHASITLPLAGRTRTFFFPRLTAFSERKDLHLTGYSSRTFAGYSSCMLEV